jgi:hypothetical protein
MHTIVEGGANDFQVRVFVATGEDNCMRAFVVVGVTVKVANAGVGWAGVNSGRRIVAAFIGDTASATTAENGRERIWSTHTPNIGFTRPATACGSACAEGFEIREIVCACGGRHVQTVIAQELLRRQLELAPKEDLSVFDGQWVVLREGYVVDHAEDAHDLVIADGDAILRVATTPRIVI